mmetsp:Transcript_12538/g.27090  ORF Transcript_12538/g.27090 Transcript_12538/m.27090 type:complete len:139 (-) Transcript_12538:22-438(-)
MPTYRFACHKLRHHVVHRWVRAGAMDTKTTQRTCYDKVAAVLGAASCTSLAVQPCTDCRIGSRRRTRGGGLPQANRNGPAQLGLDNVWCASRFRTAHSVIVCQKSTSWTRHRTSDLGHKLAKRRLPASRTKAATTSMT